MSVVDGAVEIVMDPRPTKIPGFTTRSAYEKIVSGLSM